MATGNVTVVLAHGAWADGSSWARVVTLLTELGAKVTAAPLPLSSLQDDSDALERTLERVAGPVLLVGHAYAGAPIAEVRSENIRALAYITGLAPARGENVSDVFYRAGPRPSAPKLAPDDHGWIWLPQDAFRTAFAQNASEDDLAVLEAAQRPISIKAITAPVGNPLWETVPSWFLLAGQDRMIAPETQRFMAERMKAKLVAHDVDHTPQVTAPKIVTSFLADILRNLN